MISATLSPKELSTLFAMLRQDCHGADFAIESNGVSGTELIMEHPGIPGKIWWNLSNFDNWFRLADAVRIEYAERFHAH